jgi:hypothetical protein
MLRHLQGGKMLRGDFEDRRGFFPHIGLGVVIAGVQQFSLLLLAQGEMESFGHGKSFRGQNKCSIHSITSRSLLPV